MWDGMEELPDEPFCNDFANPTDITVECSDPGDCCASMREEHITYDEATHVNRTELLGLHGCKAEIDRIPNPQTHKCVEHQNECFDVDLSTLPDPPDNVTIFNIELCFCTEDRCNSEDPYFPPPTEVPTTTTTGSECPIGWINGEKFCYHVSEERLNWGASQEYCWGLGGYLAEFSSLEEEHTLDSVLNHEVIYWIGLSDFAQEGTWRWQESHQIPSYNNWFQTEPYEGDCAVKTWSHGYAGQWGDYYCDSNYINDYGPTHALCRKEK